MCYMYTYYLESDAYLYKARSILQSHMKTVGKVLDLQTNNFYRPTAIIRCFLSPLKLPLILNSK